MLFDAIIFILLFVSIILNVVLLLKLIFPDGHIVVTTKSDGKILYSLELDTPPEEINKMKLVIFKVKHKRSSEYDDVPFTD